MNFSPFKPESSISGFVNKFVIVHSSHGSKDPFLSDVVPTGYNYFNFAEFNAAFYHHPDRSVRLNENCLINGHLQKSQVKMEIVPPFTLMNCELQPTGLYYLFGRPAYEFTDQYIPLDKVIPASEANELIHGWLHAESDTDKIAHVSEFIKGRTRGKSPDHYIDTCVSHIQQVKGRVTVDELTAQAGVGRRQLEKKFREMVGIPPGYYSSMIQFIESLKILDSTPKIQLQDLAYQAGYYDVPHLLNTFKKFSGNWPSAFNLLQKRYIKEIIK